MAIESGKYPGVERTPVKHDPRRGPDGETDRPPRVGIVTDETHSDLTDDGRAIAAALGARGVDAEPFVWTDAVGPADGSDPSSPTDTATPERYDALLFRSCWDYHADYERFRSFLDLLEATTVDVYNPVDVVRWNCHKSYLTALAAAGVPTVPTACYAAGSDVSLDAELRDRGWGEAVVKPAVGAGSEGVWRTSTVDADGARFDAELADRDLLFQRFVLAIESGERSIVFVRGTYSHAWNDLPQSDDFSAFEETGLSHRPSSDTVAAARDALAAACRIVGRDPADLPYARVDYLDTDDGFAVMELELVEPDLEIGTAPAAVERIADAVVALAG